MTSSATSTAARWVKSFASVTSLIASSPFVEEAQRVVGHRLADLDLDRHLGDLVPDRLEAADRPPERLALLGVFDGDLEQALHPADRAERHQQPLPLEVGHDQVEAAVLLSQQVLGGDLDVGEAELAGVGGVPAHLLELRDDLVAGHVALEDQERDAVVAALLGGLDRADEEVGADAVGDEGLGPVDDVAAVDRPRVGADAGDVRAGAGLGDPERADLLALDRRDQEALVLLGGPELEDRRESRCRCGRRARRRPRRRRPSRRAPRSRRRRGRSRRPGRRARSGYLRPRKPSSPQRS